MTTDTPRKRRKAVIWISVVAAVVVLAVVGVVVGTKVYTNSENAKASAAPSVAASRQASTLDTADLSGAWTVGGDSEAGYRVHEVLNGSDVTVTGRTDSVSGSATVDGTSITKATITVQVADIATDSDQRDSYFRDSALDTSAFPEATFTLTEPVADAVPSGSDTKTVRASGELTMHGVTKDVTAELQIGLNGDGVDISGSIPVTFSDFDVQAPSLGFVTVDDSGAVEFLVHATPAN
ncbi:MULTISPECIES: YceI family protein [unclassified Curtobacterium]|uniref:YceI family protein n=1 Tax=unclassified Curtobacterium TaxID=257496 RepID=UPI0008DE866B|nr:MULTISPECIES: YceI family protein [unclassified Curtobacterium]OIH98350.1 polyisoprenoid-binding protein [Curtobacterium sp. MCBA15_003]OII14170.1 polyisoprenoid-binding protein [Curtobacterium sp. MCBA15_009]OII32567.1 polyisoprenoid-binding protein [Curtobacterium sp. MMLR14_006]